MLSPSFDAAAPIVQVSATERIFVQVWVCIDPQQECEEASYSPVNNPPLLLDSE